MIVLTLKPKRHINQNTMAVILAHLEGKKVSLPISQVKEVLKLTLEHLGEELKTNPLGVLELLKEKQR